MAPKFLNSEGLKRVMRQIKIAAHSHELPKDAEEGQLVVTADSKKVFCYLNGKWIHIAESSTPPTIHSPYVKCEYCDSWVDTTHINCPNCGAPIKRR